MFGKELLAQGKFSWTNRYGKSSTQFTPEDWREIIDATWGPGLPTEEKLALFDFWYNEVELQFAGFHNIELDIFAMRRRYRPEIEAGVSRGRFAAIMSNFTFNLQELHTYIYNIRVRNTPLQKGVPLFVIGQWGTNAHFGALLTPLPDSTLLVYKALPNHRLGLRPGDLVLGYDGVPWKDLYPQLLEAELPLYLNSVNASTEEANTYYLLQSAGLNWHLFDTIDIVSVVTGDTLHYNTNFLAGETRPIWGSEQIDVPGVVWPDRSRGDRVSWGTVDGTEVGYVYVTSWAFDAQFNIREQFKNAVDSLMHYTDTCGIIFDFRYNTGGGALAADGFKLLFNETVATVGFDRRIRGENPYAMQPDPLRSESGLVIRGDANTYYDKPIAILIGPGSISAGELEALRLSFHPRARLFGKAAPGGNSGSSFIDVGNSDWFASLSDGSMYLVSTHEYLVHIGLQPDEKVWLTREDVVKGVDTVVEAALEWIENGTTSIDERESEIPQEITLAQNYPNPFNPETEIRYTLPNTAKVNLSIYNLKGQRIRDLLNNAICPDGSHTVSWDGKDDTGHRVASGTYLYRLQIKALSSGKEVSRTRKMVFLK